jgi:hypothetical protein
MITNSQPHVRAIIVFICVKNVCACIKLHYGKVLLAVMTSTSYGFIQDGVLALSPTVTVTGRLLYVW